MVKKTEKRHDLLNITELQELLGQEAQSILMHIDLDPAIYLVDNPVYVSSAAIVKFGRNYRIYISREFYDEYITTREDILYVLLHEIYHWIQNDFARPLPVNEDEGSFFLSTLANIAADMIINSRLRKYFPIPPGVVQKIYDPASSSIFSILGPPELLLAKNKDEVQKLSKEKVKKELRIVFTRIIENLIDSIARWNYEFYRIGPLQKDDNIVEKYISLWKKRMHFVEEIVRIYYDCWFGDASFPYLFTQLYEFFKKMRDNKDISFIIFLDSFSRSVFLGSHRLSDRLRFHTVDPEKKLRSQAEKIYASIKKAFYEGGTKSILTDGINIERSLLPAPSRWETYLLYLKQYPVFFHNPLFMPSYEEKLVHIYIDVSGSMNWIISFIYGLLNELRDYISNELYIFSNVVENITLKDLENGRVITTDGTDFDCVAEHALNNCFRKILIISDGEGGISPENQELLRQNVQVYAILISQRISGPLPELCGGEKAKNRNWWHFDPFSADGK